MCSETIETVPTTETVAKSILENLGIEQLNKDTGIEVTIENLKTLLLQSNCCKCALPNSEGNDGRQGLVINTPNNISNV
jgi:hypothetical protein